MSEALKPVITDVGLAAVFAANNAGLQADITHIGLGDYGRIPNKNETTLRAEKMRVPIADGTRLDPHQIHMTGVADGVKEFWVKEIGFFLSDGTLLAVWSDVKPIAFKSAEVPFLMAFDLLLTALPADSVNIICTDTDLSLAAYAEKFISNAAATITTEARVIKNAHWNMQLSEKIRLMEINT